MTYTEYMTIKNNLIVDTKYGKKRVINLKNKSGGDEAIWIDQLDSMSHLKPRQTVEVIRGIKGKLSILEREEALNQNGNRLQHISEPLERISEELNLPRLSPNQKRELAEYVQQQSNLFKHITDTVSSTMPDLRSQDHRAIAMSIFIDCQRRING